MQFDGTEEIAASRRKVWRFLMDPQQVGSCGPGVQSIEVVDEDHFNARAKVGVGFITATFNVQMTFIERDEPNRARIQARGQAPGSAVDAIGEMTLSDGPNGGTRMDWSAKVNISGTLASVGARLIEGTAHKLIDQTFACIRTKLEAEPEAPEAIAPTPVAAEPATASTAPAPASVAATQPSAPPPQVPAIVRRTAPVEYLIQPV